MIHDDSPCPAGRELLTEPQWEAVAIIRLALSQVHLEIVKGVLDDHTKERIAADLRVSSHTIDMQTRVLYAHLGVHSRVQLVVRVFAAHNALIEEERDSTTRARTQTRT